MGLDNRHHGWIRLRSPLGQEPSDSAARRWADALDDLRLDNPALYKKVMGLHLCERPNERRRKAQLEASQLKSL